MLCEAMKWNHLPEAGGIYDQKPGLVDRFYYILAEKSKFESEEAKRQKAESQSKGAGKGGRFRRGR